MELSYTEDQLMEVATKLLHSFQESKLFLFEGEMGAGKTTLIKALCRALGTQDELSSPTFSIINEYRTPSGIIYHMDLYRVNHVGELFDLGIEEYLASGAYCFIEWPDKIMTFISSPFVKIQLSHGDKIRYLRAGLV